MANKKRPYSTGSLARGLDSHGVAHTVRDRDGNQVLPWGSNENLSPTGLVWLVDTGIGSLELSSAEIHGMCIGLAEAKRRADR